MEIPDCAWVVLERIQKLDPENASKVFGYLLLAHTSESITEFAFGTDEHLQSLISKAKNYLLSCPEPLSTSIHYHFQPPNDPYDMPQSPPMPKTFSCPSSFRLLAVAPHLDPYLAAEQQLLHSMDNHHFGDLHPYNQAEFVDLEEHLGLISPCGPEFPGNYLYLDASLGLLRSMKNVPVKPCHYFHKGFCKHGKNCRFFHDRKSLPEVYFQGTCMNDVPVYGRVFSNGFIEKLDREIAELLMEKRGVLVSTATLPLLYYAKYGKSLQADGYLTESQRHGKTGYNLTKLLTQLPSIQLIDKPHGQHSVVLLEDAPKYMENINDVRSFCASSSQIYLTFPAESDFTSEDVSDYFNKFGPVCDVRIPHQERRMYGFVSFVHPDTARHVLSMAHPHIIKNSRVLVKPYKEKSRLVYRNTAEKTEYTIHHHRPYFYFNPENNTMPRLYDNTRFLRRQLIIEEQQQDIEFETRRFLRMQLNPDDTPDLVSAELKIPEDSLSYPNELRNISMTDEIFGLARGNHHCDNGYRDPIELLPESPFAAI